MIYREHQALLPGSSYLAHRPHPPPLLSASCLSFSICLCVASWSYWWERGGGVGQLLSIQHSLRLQFEIVPPLNFFHSDPSKWQFLNKGKILLGFQNQPAGVAKQWIDNAQTTKITLIRTGQQLVGTNLMGQMVTNPSWTKPVGWGVLRN
jgi:hypothetical protein